MVRIRRYLLGASRRPAGLPRLSIWEPLQGLLALGVFLLVAAGVGSLVGVGPLARTVPPDKVTDPREMIARSLQATLDASSVHVDGTQEGILPGALLERAEASVDLAGTTITADLRPRDARTRTHVASPALGIDVDAITVWTDAWYGFGGGPWQKAPVGEVTSGTGVDVNPLTIVDRLRSYLATSGRMPVLTDVECASASGRCHELRLDAGTDPAAVLMALLPGATDGSLPAVSTVIILRTDSLTLRPASLMVEAASQDGTIDLRLALAFGNWDGPVRIDAPPAGGG